MTDKMPRHTSIAAVGWYHSNPQVRLYCQTARKHVAAYKWSGGGKWTLDETVIGPLQLGRLSSALEWVNGNELRFYYQADDDTICEHCKYKDFSWFKGSFVGS